MTCGESPACGAANPRNDGFPTVVPPIAGGAFSTPHKASLQDNLRARSTQGAVISESPTHQPSLTSNSLQITSLASELRRKDGRSAVEEPRGSHQRLRHGTRPVAKPSVRSAQNDPGAGVQLHWYGLGS